MSLKRDQLVETAERLFYREGFFATGVDRVISEAGVARMTFYKHFPSKDLLVLAVLDRRDKSYWARLTAGIEEARTAGMSLILAVFDAHAEWLEGEGKQGCLFLKALGEYAGHVSEIAEAAITHKRCLLSLMRELVQAEGLSADANLDEQLAVLLEGATAMAQILPPHHVARQVRDAAEHLIASATPT